MEYFNDNTESNVEPPPRQLRKRPKAVDTHKTAEYTISSAWTPGIHKDFSWPKAKGRAFEKVQKWLKENWVQGKAWKLAELKRYVAKLEGK